MDTSIFNPLAALTQQNEQTHNRRLAAMNEVMAHLNEVGASAPSSDNSPAQLSVGAGSKGAPGGSQLERFLSAIAKQESSGRYNALGVVTRSGDRAYGKYQIMGNNIPSWSRAAIGRAVTPQEFLRSPQIQEAVARYKLTNYFNKYGAGGAAKAWYGGEGAARRNSNAPQYGGPSLNAYAAQVLAKMGL